MKEGWTTKSISELCDQMNGIWKGAKPPFVTAKILRTTNFTKDCQLRLDDLAIIDVEQKKMDARRLQRGDIIVEKSGGGPKQPVGRVVLFNIDDSDYSFCNFTSALRIKHQTELLPDYLYKYLTYLYFSGETEKYQSNLVGFRNLDFKGYVSMKVSYPSLSEQQRIVGILDAEFEKIDALKANAEKNLQNAKDLFQAALKKELEPKHGWNETILGNIATVFSGYAFKSGNFKKQGKYQVLRIGNIKQNCLKLSDNAVFVDDIDEITLKKALLKIGDLVITQTGTRHKRDYGYVAMINDDHLLLNQRNACVRFKDLLSAKFFLYYSYTEMYKDSYFADEGGTVGQGNVGLGALKDMIYHTPSPSALPKIITQLDSLRNDIDCLSGNLNKTIALCDDLKQALLRKAFSGEL